MLLLVAIHDSSTALQDAAAKPFAKSALMTSTAIRQLLPSWAVMSVTMPKHAGSTGDLT
jgi:hypothetical protein